MSKIGVGVGEEFPVDDGDGNKAADTRDAQTGGDDRAEFEAWKRRRDDERRYYEEKRQRHEEWDQRKREFKDRIKTAARAFGDDARDHWHDHDRPDYHGHDRHGHRSHAMRFWPVGVGIALLVLAIPVLIVALFFSLISAAFKAPFVILAIAAIAALFFVMHHRRGYHHYRFASNGHGHPHEHGRRYYYDSNIETPPRPQTPPQSPKPAPIITPPPATGS